MARRMDVLIDRLGTTILVSLPAAPETVMALTLLLAYQPMALCSGLLRFGPLKGSAIIGEALLTAAVSAALSLGFDKAEVSDVTSPSAPQGSDRHGSERGLCDTEAKVSMWWTLSAWQAYFALNNTPFKPHCLDQEAERASSYIRLTETISDPEVDVLRQQGRIYLAHRILMLTEIYAAIEQLETICSRLLGSPAAADIAARPSLPPVVQEIRREAEALCQRTHERLTEVEEARSVVAVRYGHSSEVTFLEGWLSLEQSSLHSLFLSKAAVAGVTGTTDFILPLPTFIETIRTSQSTSIWLERPGRARREAAERAIGAFCGLEDGDSARAHSCNGRRDAERHSLTISDAIGMHRSGDGRPPTDQLWASAPILTAALLMDSCRALLEAEAFTRLVSRRQSSRRECLTVLVKQAAARLKQSCAIRNNHHASGSLAAQQSPVNNCVAAMLEEMLVTLSQWHRRRSHQLARAAPRNGALLQAPRTDTDRAAAASALAVSFPSGFREQASAALPDLTLAPAPTEADDQALSFMYDRHSHVDAGLQWSPIDHPTDALWLDLLLSIESACT
jgi:hypothetical protein